MNIKFNYYISIIITLFFLSCGMPQSDTIMISGSIDRSMALPVKGPTCLIITDTDDFEKIENDPMNSVITMITVADDGKFEIDLTEYGLSMGDTIYLSAFIDNDYSNGIPYPTVGDFIGYYVNTETFSPAYVISDNNSGLIIEVSRRVYDFNSHVTGTVSGPETGDLMVIAYAGEITSIDPSALDINLIMGYEKISKTEENAEYNMKIMPFGQNVPMDNVYIIALLDQNGNGIPDNGDLMGFYSDNPSGIPTQMTITEGTVYEIDMTVSMTLQEPSGYEMTMEGNFAAPAGYNSSSAPIYIMVAETDDPAALFNNPLEAVKAFKKLNPGDTSFSIDLSSTDLAPGDQVMVLALWDKNNSGGFPNPDLGDSVGYFQNTDVNNFAFTLTLSDASPNMVYHQPAGDWKFEINKNIFDYDTQLQFKIKSAGRPGGMSEDNELIVIAIYHEGVQDDNMLGSDYYMITDINYVLGMAYLPYRDDADHVYSIDILNAIDERIADTSSMDLYLYVIYDRDGNGMPSGGDDVAAYYQWGIHTGFQYLPKKFNLQSNALNDMGDGVRFLGKTY